MNGGQHQNSESAGPVLAATANQHPDDEAVDRFAAALKSKLADARAKGRAGWQDKTKVSAETLSAMLLDHVFKGDPRDVANLAMFLHQRGEGIVAVKESASLERMREQLLAPRAIVRNEDGHLTHPALPAVDERVRYDELLSVFGIEAAFVSMESDVSPEVMERYFDAGEPDCSYWTPTPPTGDGWLLLEIYDTEDGPYALFGRAMPEEAWPRYYGGSVELGRHLARQIAFSFRTFGPGQRTQGVIDHIRKELREIEADPHNIEEWIDVVLLALDGAWRAELGHCSTHRTALPATAVSHAAGRIAAELAFKQARNEARSWPDWRTADPDKAIEHHREAST